MKRKVLALLLLSVFAIVFVGVYAWWRIESRPPEIGRMHWIAELRGFISGTTDDDFCEVTITIPDGRKGSCGGLGNAEWFWLCEEEGKYTMRAKAEGYVSSPELYEVEVVKGDKILNLNFTFSPS